MRITTRLIALLVSAVIAVMAVYAVVTVSRTREMLTEELRKMAEHIGLALSVGTLHHLQEGDLGGVSSVLETIVRNPDVAGAAVYGPDGHLLGASGAILQGESGSAGRGSDRAHGQDWFEEREGSRVYIHTSAIRAEDGSLMGSLRLALWERSMLPYTLQSRNHILITIGVLTAVLSLVVIYVSRKEIAEPLATLSRGAEALGSGQLGHRIEVSAGEIGALAETFNRMAANLEAGSQRLRAEREYARSILDSIPEGIIVVDERMRVAAWNRRMADEFGLPLEKVLGKTLEKVLPSGFPNELGAMLREVLSDNATSSAVRQLRWPGEEERVFSALGSPLKGSADGLKGTVFVLVDITERLRLQRQVQRSEKLAAVGQLAAGLAHEIGTPLNVISGSAEYMLARGEGESEDLKTIVSESGRIGELVRRLLAFARHSEPRTEEVAVSEVLESVMALMRRQMERQGIRVHSEVAPDLPPVMADRDQLQQLFLNLVVNAWQVMPDGGDLTLAARADHRAAGPTSGGHWVTVEVRDTGAGIPEEDTDKVFDPFYTTKDVGEGTGLGLAIAHRIVEDHEGRISVSSRPGEGSTFTVELPERGEGVSDG